MRKLCALGLLLAACTILAGNGATAPMKHSHRYQVAQALARGLRGTPVARQAWVLEDVAYHDGISPFFIAGAAGTESSVWRAPCPGDRFNGWGVASCGAAWADPGFTSYRQAFDWYARYIRRQWPSARTPYDLHNYCGCGDIAWGNKTVAWIRQLFGNVPTGLAYP